MTTPEPSEAAAFETATETILAASRTLLAISVRSVLNAPVEVTVAQHRVLVILAEHGPLTVNRVAAHLGVDQSNAGRHCQRLHRAGLVDRVRCETDGRSVEVAITEAGTRLIDEVTSVRRRHIASVLERMAPGDVTAAARSLTAFNEAAEATRLLSL